MCVCESWIEDNLIIDDHERTHVRTQKQSKTKCSSLTLSLSSSFILRRCFFCRFFQNLSTEIIHSWKFNCIVFEHHLIYSSKENIPFDVYNWFSLLFVCVRALIFFILVCLTDWVILTLVIYSLVFALWKKPMTRLGYTIIPFTFQSIFG